MDAVVLLQALIDLIKPNYYCPKASKKGGRSLWLLVM